MNDTLTPRLEVRRHFLKRYHKKAPITVLDMYPGTGAVWNRLRQEFTVATYWALGGPRKGALDIEPRHIVEQPGWNYSVVDIDTPASPWALWLSMLRTAPNTLTVFLSHGNARTRVDAQLMRSLGLTFKTLSVPPALAKAVTGIASAYMLRTAEDHGFKLVEVAEAFPSSNSRYLGVRLERKA